MSRFDDFLGAAKDAQGEQAKPDKETADTKKTGKNSKVEFWESMQVQEKEREIRLSVSIPQSLDDLIATKARELRMTKNALLNRVLAHMFTEDE